MSVKMKFNPNKTLIEVIREGAFEGTCFRDIYWREVQKIMKRI